MGVGKLKRAARKMVVAACASFSSSSTSPNPTPNPALALSLVDPPNRSSIPTSPATSTSVCPICLDPLSYKPTGDNNNNNTGVQAIFTAQCSHAFHFGCISSNVRYGSVTCPICRAHWTQLPRNLNQPCSLSCNPSDPIFQILDDSIATFRVHRRSFLRSARYDDDDPIEQPATSDHTSHRSRLLFSLVPIPPILFHHHHPRTQSQSSCTLQTNGCTTSLFDDLHNNLLPIRPSYVCTSSSSNRRATPAYLSVKLAHQQAIDMVLVASPNGPHLRLLKQSMALVVFSLRPTDRLAIVTYSSAAARVFPLRRMTSYGKRTALQVIDRLFYMGQADPVEGLRKGIKIFEDRAHKNPQSCILHLSDSPTTSHHSINMQAPFPIHRFHVGFGFGTSNGFVMHEFEDFLQRLLGGVIRDVQLRIGEEARVVRLGELRGNEERRIAIELADQLRDVYVQYSYIEGEVDEFITRGETVVSTGDKGEAADDAGSEEAAAARDVSILGARTSCVESWDYHDPYMARRWAKHLHGYRI
ncbi:hypothetical protein Tsubulata_012109 [Turnera subulata]|uniref:RING-type domain-containing protein n=1 Tax=Turnera subulata TaxID=218843 RepID=A0A9Q0J529_9ROSI|nr:hypothetical protein Tsubulata_012109 [Turnera subulata]